MRNYILYIGKHPSLEGLQEDTLENKLGIFTPDKNYEGDLQADQLLQVLTKRQRTVASLLNEGKTRKEISDELQVCIQAIHQIVLRIRKRLNQRGRVAYKPARQKPKKLDDTTKTLIYILRLSQPNLTSEAVYNNWYKHPVLKDYDKPKFEQIQKAFTEK